MSMLALIKTAQAFEFFGLFRTIVGVPGASMAAQKSKKQSKSAKARKSVGSDRGVRERKTGGSGKPLQKSKEALKQTQKETLAVDGLSGGGSKKRGSVPAQSAARTIAIEMRALERLREAIETELAKPFSDAIALLKKTKGRIIVTGIGKSGHIGQKIAATFASTGNPAFFVHPSEASHGDLGMITQDDAIVALSWSGETVELSNILSYASLFSVPLISLTSSRLSALGRASTIVLELPKAEEACPHGLAPTTSTTMQLALGDSLAVALLEARGFTARDFKVFHPGGSLGAQLKLVADVMHGADALPLAREDMSMGEALLIMTQKSFGCLGVVDKKGRLIGIVTDGDLRRHMNDDLMKETVGAVMTPDPKTIAPDTLSSMALEHLNALRITALFVVSKEKPVGLVHVHDLLRLGIS
ncbi:MAG: KpsF/GutQ family sugar-phosphate isomerase [Pseudomonadota bacterium]